MTKTEENNKQFQIRTHRENDVCSSMMAVAWREMTFGWDKWRPDTVEGQKKISTQLNAFDEENTIYMLLDEFVWGIWSKK